MPVRAVTTWSCALPDEFDRLVELLKPHGDRWPDPLNRLVRKAVQFRHGEDYLPPLLTRENVTITERLMPFAALCDAAKGYEQRDRPPRRWGVPFVVLEWRGQRYLIDGHRRLDALRRAGHEGPQRALIVSVRRRPD